MELSSVRSTEARMPCRQRDPSRQGDSCRRAARGQRASSSWQIVPFRPGRLTRPEGTRAASHTSLICHGPRCVSQALQAVTAASPIVSLTPALPYHWCPLQPLAQVLINAVLSQPLSGPREIPKYSGYSDAMECHETADDSTIIANILTASCTVVPTSWSRRWGSLKRSFVTAPGSATPILPEYVGTVLTG